jgi:hypothetical protein
MNLYLKPILATALMALALAAQSQPRPLPPGSQPVEDVPPPPQIADDPALEPQVTIRAKGQDRVEEYRIKGKLYKMRIVPVNGAPYWLVDPKGDGTFVKVDGPAPNIAVPMWVIHSW